MSAWIVLCKDCGGTEEAHHPFVPAMPPGCVCAPVEWDLSKPVSVPCKAFVTDGDNDFCVRCEHDRECHRTEKP